MRALRAYRNLAAALDPARARRTLRELHALPPDEGAALISSCHTTLAQQREDALAAQRAIALIRTEAANEAEPTSEDTMTITELAGAIGVRTSTLRFWEKAGPLVPERVTSRAGAARRYPVPVVREARIVATLRAAGYRIPEVQEAMRAIRRLEGIEEPLRVLQARVDVLARHMLALLRAETDIAELLALG